MYLWPTASSMNGFGESFGVATAPAMKMVSKAIQEGRPWGCDNDAFSGRFEAERFLRFLVLLQPYRETCLYVSVPDVVGNAIATLQQWRTRPWWWRIKEMAFSVAFVAQDGQELFDFPPSDQWDVLFVGGTTAWKLSAGADECITRAQRLGKHTHVGRVNSVKRLRHFERIGVDSCDGTGPTNQPAAYRKLFDAAFQQAVFPVHAVSGQHSRGQSVGCGVGSRCDGTECFSVRGA